ncbi:MAG: putative transcriptional regulator [Glaciecola sp.]|jgi:predicted transcriptional regulator
MKKHSGMRPLDIAVLLKIVSKGQQQWFMKDLAQELEISSSEISESINRSVLGGLIGNDKKSLNKLALLDFIKSGLRYVYPQLPGSIVRGIATAHSAPPLNSEIISNEQFVWPFGKGNTRGQAIEPLHPKTPEACLKDTKYYELLALTDAIRVGKVREQNMAFEMIKQRIDNA